MYIPTLLLVAVALASAYSGGKQIDSAKGTEKILGAIQIMLAGALIGIIAIC